jgi:hypothetical protein
MTEHRHDDEADDLDDAFEMELGTQSQIFLEMRGQNLELLRIAAQVSGFGGDHTPVKPADLKQSLRTIWEVYSELYSWIDPEEAEMDEEED